MGGIRGAGIIPAIQMARAPGAAAADSYDLIQDFTIPDAAPLTNPLIADVKGQQNTSECPAAYLIDSNGANWPTVVQGHRYFSPASFARAAGVAVYNKWQIHFLNNGGSDSTGTYFGFCDPAKSFWESAMVIRFLTAANISQLQNNIFAVPSPQQFSIIDDVYHHTVSVLLSRGSLHFVQSEGGGNFLNWTLYWVERFSSTATLIYSVAHTGGFDSTLWRLYHRAERAVTQPSPLWRSGDYVGGTQLAVTNGTTAVMESIEDGFSLKLPTIYTTGGFTLRFRKVDALNYCYITVAPNGANNTVTTGQVVAGANTPKGSSTMVASDLLTFQVNRPTASNHYRMVKNQTYVNFTTDVSTPSGTGVEVVNSGDGVVSELAMWPRTVSSPPLLAWLNALKTAEALP